MHAPVTPHARAHPPVTRTRTAPRRADRLLPDLRRVLAGAGQLPLDLLGEGPVRDRVEAAARVDTLARELVARMQDAGWDEGAAPRVVTSVLAASVPEAEAVLRRVARGRR
ncbi:hypothetical protein Acsp06_28480 [Actinomycetospora sp. NBRC 106375]|uniref:hypothetical protein n=1 Tax=Actinomycetospora sp. NBRC 106375 TaxID=3032207 RepID=UPI0024A0057D|nr:hypothetical protein [Actinomycetospora sp. NBRC 106375]GLZ46663.1 hypothetical protein Acsp06_28480 [Actinomycetospora sp. NBRC 106375]